MDSRITLGAYTAVLGILMIWAGIKTATGGGWYFQVGMGVALLIVGVGSFFYYRHAVAAARIELAGMKH